MAWVTLSIVLLLGGLTLILFSPELVTLLGIAALYLNLPGVAVSVHGLPLIVAASVFALLGGPLLVRLLVKREAVLVDRPLLLMIAFLGTVLLSSFAVRDLPAATKWLTTFLVEGLLMYVLALNLFRTLESLRRVLDVLMVCGALLGGMTLYQESTRSYTQQFSGLAQRNIEYGTGEEFKEKDLLRNPEEIRLHERAGGPLGEPNRYAQILILLLPPVYFRMRAQRKPLFKYGYALCGLLILSGILLTFSRGAFVTLIILMMLLKWMGGIRLKSLALFAGVAAMAVLVLSPGYVLRIGTLGGAAGTAGESQSEETDVVFRGRLTEMLASLNVVIDHPLLGVGPGQYLPVYSQVYMNDPDIAFRRITVNRRGHSLYLELAAETGLAGIGIFLGIIWLVQLRLLRAWRRWRQQEELAGLAGGFFLGLTGYLVSGIFLHLAYQRYYWLFLGLAGAALQVLSRKDRHSVEQQEARA